MAAPAYDLCHHHHDSGYLFRPFVCLCLPVANAAVVVGHADADGLDWPPLWLTVRRLDVRFVDWAKAMSATVSALPTTHRWDPNAAAVDAVAPVAALHHGHGW